jgi:hypothetical protein
MERNRWRVGCRELDGERWVERDGLRELDRDVELDGER